MAGSLAALARPAFSATDDERVLARVDHGCRRHRVCRVGAPLSWPQLERHGHCQAGSRAYTHRPLPPGPPSDLYRLAVGDPGHRHRVWRVARLAGLRIAFRFAVAQTARRRALHERKLSQRICSLSDGSAGLGPLHRPRSRDQQCLGLNVAGEDHCRTNELTCCWPGRPGPSSPEGSRVLPCITCLPSIATHCSLPLAMCAPWRSRRWCRSTTPCSRACRISTSSPASGSVTTISTPTPPPGTA